jgi:flavorubredoxin
MREFLEHLRTKGFRNRRVGLIEDGSWAPDAARLMRTKLEEMKDIHLYETVVSLRGALNQTSEAQMDALVAELCAE